MKLSEFIDTLQNDAAAFATDNEVTFGGYHIKVVRCLFPNPSGEREIEIDVVDNNTVKA